MHTLRLFVAVLLLFVAGAAHGKVDPGLKCLAAKVKAAGKGVAGGVKCHAKAAKLGVAADPACLSAAQAKFTGAYDKAQAKGGCLSDDGQTAAAAEVARAVGAIATTLRPETTASRCQGAKLGAAGKRAGKSLIAHAKFLRKGDRSKLQQAIAKVRGKFAEKFTKSDAKGGCLTTDDATTAGGAVDATLDGIMATLDVVTRSTEMRTSPAEPPDTPGSPGVTVSNAKLITQFGGTGFSLNSVTWTRWRLNGPDVNDPDAVLVAVPGFGGGAGNFSILAENLIPRLLEDHGVLVELWGFDRRTEQLEDRSGFLIAAGISDPLVALDWYYGADLGLTLSPQLSRRAVFYNKSDDIPFIANWTPLVFSRDIDAVIDEANTASGGNAFLAGHSAGTGFAARYAATDLNLTGTGSPDPGYAKLRGLVMFEGGGGTTATTPLTADTLDRIEAKADGGLFGAVSQQVGLCVDGATSCTVATQAADCVGQVPPTCTVGRCVDGTTACTIATEAADCVAQVPPKCTLRVDAHGVILGISPQILASAEPAGVQALTDADSGRVILQVDQGAPGNNAIAKVPDLALLAALPPGTVHGLFGSFLDDDGLFAALSAAVASSIGATGPTVGGLLTWASIDERTLFPACPGVTCPTPNNGPQPTTLPGAVWGQEKEVTRIERLGSSFAGIEGANASDWYYPVSGLGVTSVSGVCTASVCTVGNVGAACTTSSQCSQAISLDSTALSVGRNRRDIENLTQAPSVDIPVLCLGGSNGLTPVPARFTPLAESLGACTAPSCTGLARVVDANVPNPAFPTFGEVGGGFEVVIAEGFAHIDVVSAEDDADNPVLPALSDFIARNVQ